MKEPIAIDRPNIKIDGTITVKLRNGRHFTYRLSTVKKGGLEGRRIIELLVGSNNQEDYKAFAFVTADGGVRIWSKCYTEAYIKHAELLLGNANQHVEMWYQAGKCVKCGRVLTDPESIELGIGPKCGGRA